MDLPGDQKHALATLAHYSIRPQVMLDVRRTNQATRCRCFSERSHYRWWQTPLELHHGSMSSFRRLLLGGALQATGHVSAGRIVIWSLPRRSNDWQSHRP